MESDDVLETGKLSVSDLFIPFPEKGEEYLQIVADDRRQLRNEKRRLRYQAKHSKKAKHARLLSELAEAKKELARLQKIRKECKKEKSNRTPKKKKKMR